MRIHEELRQERAPNCRKLSEALEVSTKTIMRDIEFMRDRLGLPIVYEDSEYAYRYETPVDSFPTVQVTEGEMFALLVAQKAMEQYRGTPFEHTLESAFGKIVSGLSDSISFKPAASAVSFRNVGVSDANIEVFQLLSQAIKARRELRFQYQKLDDAESAERRVEPHHLACVQGAWYLVAHDPERKAMRTFALTRISTPSLGRRTFPRRTDFDPEKFFANSFGVITGEGTHEVVVRFDARAGRIVSERFWHSSQSLRELPDGGIELSLRVSDLTEIEKWVLGWGAQAQVLAPAELGSRVSAAAEAMVALYKGSKVG